MKNKTQKSIISIMLMVTLVAGCFAALAPAIATPSSHQRSQHRHVWGELDYSEPRNPFADPFVKCEICGCRHYVYSWEITDVDPTCTADGYTQYKNSAGWMGWIYDEDSALGHQWGEFDYTQGRVPFADPVATCERCGWYGYVYSWEITDVDPTCTADGYTQYKNSAGWMGWIYDEDSALGHDFTVDDLGWGIEYKCERCGYATYIYADELYAAIETANTFLNGDFGAYTEESVATAKTWVEAKLGELYALDYFIFAGKMTQTDLEDCLANINIVANVEYAQSLLVAKPEVKTSAEWKADITDAIESALKAKESKKIQDLIEANGKGTKITVTINGEEYVFTSNGATNSDKTLRIDGVLYTINVQGNGNWRVISSV